MNFTSSLLFLGPAIGAAVTALYAMRTMRVTHALDLHIAHSDRRLDLARDFLDALEGCQVPVAMADERRKAEQAAHAALQRVRLAFPPDNSVSTSATDAAKAATVLVHAQSPLPLGDEKVLALLRAYVRGDERQRGKDCVSMPRSALTFIHEVREAQREAAAKSLTDPLPKFEAEIEQLESHLMSSEYDGIDLSKALPSTERRECHEQQARDHEVAEQAFVKARDEFVQVFAERLCDLPLPARGRRRRRFPCVHRVEPVSEARPDKA